MLGSHLLKSWSSTQAAPALSVGEAEFYGVVKACGVGLGLQSLLEDLGIVMPVRTWTDSSATIGICGRQGLGKLRHIDTRHLWVQHAVRSNMIELRKVRGDDNPADLMTKHLSSEERIRYLLDLMGCVFIDGRIHLIRSTSKFITKAVENARRGLNPEGEVYAGMGGHGGLGWHDVEV